MKKEFLAVKIFVMFGFNYSDPDEFINYICEKCEKAWLKDHLREKFDYLYDKFGSHAVMGCFMSEIDLDLQEALVDYAINVYGPRGMRSKYEEYKAL